MFECWTTMAAITQRTSRIRLGQMVGCKPYRQPRAAGEDHLEHRRHVRRPPDWGIGAGWYRNEFAGLRLRVRVQRRPHAARCARCVEIVRRMWTRARRLLRRASTTNSTGAQCDPKPLQRRSRRCWIGGGGEKLTLRVVARLADASNFGGNPQEWRAKTEVLKGHCARRRPRLRRDRRRPGRPRSSSARPSRRSSTAAAASFWGEQFESWREGNLVGTPEQVAEKIPAYRDLGCTGFYPGVATTPRPRRCGSSRSRSSRSSAERVPAATIRLRDRIAPPHLKC